MKKNPNETSAARISQVLTENGWSQSDLARRIGVRPQSVQFWVSGKTAPSGTNLSALASVSGYPEHWFLMDDISGRNQPGRALQQKNMIHILLNYLMLKPVLARAS